MLTMTYLWIRRSATIDRVSKKLVFSEWHSKLGFLWWTDLPSLKAEWFVELITLAVHSRLGWGCSWWLASSLTATSLQRKFQFLDSISCLNLISALNNAKDCNKERRLLGVPMRGWHKDHWSLYPWQLGLYLGPHWPLSTRQIRSYLPIK